MGGVPINPFGGEQWNIPVHRAAMHSPDGLLAEEGKRLRRGHVQGQAPRKRGAVTATACHLDSCPPPIGPQKKEYQDEKT